MLLLEQRRPMKKFRTSSQGQPKEESCRHPNPLCGMCVLCGQFIPETPKKIVIEKQKKLSLVLDLDHTLLNTTLLSKMTQTETEFLMPRVEENPNSALFKLERTQSMTKLRPFVRTFLEEASRLFEMYIFTMGDRRYAADMANLLDPKSIYFDRVRVISRDDLTLKKQKDLNLVPVVKRACLIIDDLETVWPYDRDNLIQIEKYQYFASNKLKNSLSELKIDESKSNGALSKVLGVLRRVHDMYFDDGDRNGSNVREILRTIRTDVLGGCKVVIGSCLGASAIDIEKKATALGVTWAAHVDLTITHVVAVDAASKESVLAVKEGKFLVSPRWIEAAYYLWERPSENMYLLTQ